MVSVVGRRPWAGSLGRRRTSARSLASSAVLASGRLAAGVGEATAEGGAAPGDSGSGRSGMFSADSDKPVSLGVCGLPPVAAAVEPVWCTYARPPTEQLWKSIKFSVSVPVLSENTYCTWPSSSFSELVRAPAKVPVGAWYISASYSVDTKQRLKPWSGQASQVGPLSRRTATHR